MIGLLGSNVSRLGLGPLDPDAVRWIAAVGESNVSPARGRLISDTIRALKGAGVWTDLDFLPVLAAENAASALVDWKARKAMTAVNTPTFTADQGYAFNGTTSYLNTGFIPSTDCVAATGTSFMMGVYERVDVNTSGRAFGANVSTSQVAHILPRSGTNTTAAMNAAGATFVTGVADSRGLTVAGASGTAGSGYKNGAAGASPTLTTPGSSLVNIALFIGGYNQAAALTLPRATTLGYCLFGRNAWTAAQHASFYAAMQSYMSRIGASV
jgi:hypothetical protein